MCSRDTCCPCVVQICSQILLVMQRIDNYTVLRYFDGIWITVQNSIALSKHQQCTCKHECLIYTCYVSFSYVIGLHFGILWVNMQVMLFFDLCSLGAVLFQLSSGENILIWYILCSVLSRRLLSCLSTACTNFNDPLQGLKETTALFHNSCCSLTLPCLPWCPVALNPGSVYAPDPLKGKQLKQASIWNGYESNFTMRQCDCM